MSELVKCDFCPAMIDPDVSEACAWMNNVPTNWICDRCSAESNRLFAQSDMMRDMRESELAEMEGATL